MSNALRAGIVIPAYNEAASISAVVGSVRKFGTVVVVDDGSTDETSALAWKAGAEVVSHETNRGYDAALASGFARAGHLGAEVIVTFDADGQIGVSALPALLEALAARQIQLVLGVRRGGAPRFAEALFNLYTRLRFHVPDILCGLKGFRTQAYARHSGKVDGPSVNTALALALLREGAPFGTIPVEIAPRQGHSRFGGSWRANVRILRALATAFMDDLLKR